MWNKTKQSSNAPALKGPPVQDGESTNPETMMLRKRYDLQALLKRPLSLIAAILALLVPEKAVAYQILALNIEKAHNLREKALEVVRMYRDLAGGPDPKEEELALEFEEPALVTLGFAYEERGRLSGSVYAPILRKVDGWLPAQLSAGVEERQRRARVVIAFDDAVAAAVARLKEKGFDSPYLKNFVVARVNPLRFMKGGAPPFDELFETMTKRAGGMDPAKVKSEDVARSGGAAGAEAE